MFLKAVTVVAEKAAEGSESTNNFAKFGKAVADNLGFFMVVLGTAVGLIVLSLLLERIACKVNGQKRVKMNTLTIAVCGMLSAVAAVLMWFEFPVFFAPPNMYKMDFSDIPAIIAGMTFGPVSGVVVEFVKIILKALILKPTSTAFVGEYANFVVGCALVVPASFIFQCRRNFKGMLFGGIAGVLVMTTFGTAMNAIYFVPKFASMFGAPVEAIVAAGAKIWPSVDSLTRFVFYCVAPLNLLKGSAAIALVLVGYKPIMSAIRSLIVSQNNAPVDEENKGFTPAKG
ncbi:MAG: ECF transporter S component [Lachnospiraceae bacterium]|nr:ECF transporter S component [Lachnospiraceae bacterium]